MICFFVVFFIYFYGGTTSIFFPLFFFFFEKLRHLTTAILRFAGNWGMSHLYEITSLAWLFFEAGSSKIRKLLTKLWDKEWILNFAHVLIVIFWWLYVEFNYPWSCGCSSQQAHSDFDGLLSRLFWVCFNKNRAEKSGFSINSI